MVVERLAAKRQNFSHPSRRRVVMLALMSRDVAEIAPEIAAVDALHDADAAES